MNVEEIRDYCLKKPCVTESTPFDEVTLVFKVCEKMFALVPLDELGCKIALKCDPEEAIRLREQYPDAVVPAWHFNKKHWNSVIVGRAPGRRQVEQWIDDSYQLVVAGLSRKQKELLKQANG
ncbi:MAG: MmcQ/YjbR family DNA-binding protein [Clostridia bacterium]|nr:MmcQ/YjbR family DNA-binding protein [Clostridia bacterium]